LHKTKIFTRKGIRSLHKTKNFLRKRHSFIAQKPKNFQDKKYFLQLGKTWNLILRYQESRAYWHLNFQHFLGELRAFDDLAIGGYGPRRVCPFSEIPEILDPAVV
jgi:hypothetical protein